MVTIDCWETANHMYECRFDSDQMTIMLDPINLVVYGEDEDETEEIPGMPKPILPIERVLGQMDNKECSRIQLLPPTRISTRSLSKPAWDNNQCFVKLVFLN